MGDAEEQERISRSAESEDKAVAWAREAAGYDTGAVEEDTPSTTGQIYPGKTMRKVGNKIIQRDSRSTSRSLETPGGDGHQWAGAHAPPLCKAELTVTQEMQKGSAEALPAASAGDTARPGDTGHGDSQVLQLAEPRR